MAVVTGLAGIRKHQAEVAEREAARNRPKAEWLTSIGLKKAGDSVVGRFMQELDEAAENYDPERGLGVIATEHEPPGKEGFKRRGLCTKEHDEAECYGCTRKRLDYVAGEPGKNWKTKTNLYINFAVKVKDEDGNDVVKAFIVSRNADSTFANQVYDEAFDEGTITDKMFRITRTGEGTQTQWILKPLPKEELIDDSGVDVYDIRETVLRDIELDKQPEYYGAVWSGPDSSEDKPATSKASKASDDEEW